MALLKEIELPQGGTANYWKIIKIETNRLSLTCFFEIALFKSQSDSDSGKKPYVERSKFFVKSCTKEELASDLTALGYDFIKASNDVDLEEAEDA